MCTTVVGLQWSHKATIRISINGRGSVSLIIGGVFLVVSGRRPQGTFGWFTVGWRVGPPRRRGHRDGPRLAVLVRGVGTRSVQGHWLGGTNGLWREFTPSSPAVLRNHINMIIIRRRRRRKNSCHVALKPRVPFGEDFAVDAAGRFSAGRFPPASYWRRWLLVPSNLLLWSRLWLDGARLLARA